METINLKFETIDPVSFKQIISSLFQNLETFQKSAIRIKKTETNAFGRTQALINKILQGRHTDEQVLLDIEQEKKEYEENLMYKFKAQ